MDRRSGTGADLSRLRSNQKIRFLKKNEEEISVGNPIPHLFFCIFSKCISLLHRMVDFPAIYAMICSVWYALK